MATTFFDAPGGIRKEGNTQTLNFTRVDSNTGTVCWKPTPPTPVAGCGTPNGVYSGGVLVGSTTPIGQLNKPKDGVCCYTGDPTLNSLEFAGDTLGGAKVLWSSNTDTTTSCITVTGLDPNCTAYYFAFFAIDNVCRYNQDGIYSYSLQLSGPAVECVPGTQTILTNGATLTDPIPQTVDTTINHPVKMFVDGQTLDVMLRGAQLSTYQSVIDELATAWKRLIPSVVSQYPPHYGEFYYDGVSTWQQHDGVRYKDVFPITQPTDPTVFAYGDLWFDTTSRTLKELTLVGWEAVSPVITYNSDPTVVSYNQYWFDGMVPRRYDGNVWLSVNFFNSLIDPSLPPSLPATAVWKRNQDFFKWSTTRNKWLPAIVLMYDGDTDIINHGTLWFNTTDSTLRLWNGIDWVVQAATVSNVEPATPSINQVWVNPSTKEVAKYNAVDDVWDELLVIFYHKQIDDENQGDLHYIPSTGTLRTYDGVTNSWLVITPTLYTTPADPSLPPVINDGDVWYNSTSGLWFKRSGMLWEGMQIVQSITDPRTITAGFWFNPTTSMWYERSGTTWSQLAPVISAVDPRTPLVGSTWFDGNTLRQRIDANTWDSRTFVTTPAVVVVGSRWEDATGVLRGWTGTEWVEIEAPYTVSLTDNNNIVLTTTSCGSLSYIDITESTLLTHSLRFTLCKPVAGNDGTSGVPMYNELGIGTDGSVDERRHLIDNIYMRLGAPTINVELTRAQVDLAIQKGLDYMRRDSGAGYTRGYFFLDLKAGKQQYVLTSKAVGFHKIVDILKLYRARGGFLNSTFGGEIYGQQLLQQLYVSSTFDILSYHLLASYQTVVQKLFASELMYDWNERTRTLRLMRKIPRDERILVDATIERTEQDLFTDRLTKNWIEEWALAEAKIMLGDIRGKYGSLPGAGGSVTLNADTLKAEGVSLKEKLVRELDDYMASDVSAWGLGGTLTKG